MRTLVHARRRVCFLPLHGGAGMGRRHDLRPCLPELCYAGNCPTFCRSDRRPTGGRHPGDRTGQRPHVDAGQRHRQGNDQQTQRQPVVAGLSRHQHYRRRRVLGADAAGRAAADPDRHYRPGEKRRGAGRGGRQRSNGWHRDAHARWCGGGTRCDIEVRYALGRGESGIYAYAIFSHPPEYGAMGVGESRYITKLNQLFDWISVDADRNMLQCAPQDWVRAASSTPRSSACSARAFIRTPWNTNTATPRCNTRCPPLAGRAPGGTSASGSSTRRSNT